MHSYLYYDKVKQVWNAMSWNHTSDFDISDYCSWIRKNITE